MAELKPCPFCGNEKVSVATHTPAKSRPYFTVHCYKCGCSKFTHHKSEIEAIEAWNRRAEDGK